MGGRLTTQGVFAGRLHQVQVPERFLTAHTAVPSSTRQNLEKLAVGQKWGKNQDLEKTVGHKKSSHR
jgi:hypothetical protein